MPRPRRGVVLPDKSRLLHTLEGKAKQMPPRKYAHQPTAREIALLREWITSGAKRDKAADSPAQRSEVRGQKSEIRKESPSALCSLLSDFWAGDEESAGFLRRQDQWAFWRQCP
jgi:hypothetical protein